MIQPENEYNESMKSSIAHSMIIIGFESIGIDIAE